MTARAQVDPSIALHGSRILLVEDDREIRTELETLLKDSGYEMETAGDGISALTRIRREPRPDLVVLDLRLPNIDGWEVRATQLAAPELADIPVLAMFADNGTNVRVRLPLDLSPGGPHPPAA